MFSRHADQLLTTRRWNRVVMRALLSGIVLMGVMTVVAPTSASATSPGTSPDTPAANTAPGTPTLRSPASGATISTDVPQIFTIQAVDLDYDPYSGFVTVFDSTGQVFTQFTTALTPSGQLSSGEPLTTLPAGTYSWTAYASDLVGNASDEPPTQPFAVSGASDAGGAALAGTAAYSSPVPAIGQPCAGTAFDLTATVAATVVSTTQTGFAGPVSLAGTGGSACETATSGVGTLALSATGLGITGTTLACPDLTGSYSRVSNIIEAVIAGSCTINGSAIDVISFDLVAVLLPDGSTASSGAPAPTSTIAGSALVAPAT